MLNGQSGLVKAGALPYSLLDTGASSAHQHQIFDVGDDLRCQRLVGDVLIVAACDEDDLPVKAAQTGNGAGGAGADGIVIVQHAVQSTHRLDAVLHAGKGAAHLTDGFYGHLAPHGSGSSQQVFNVVQTAQLDILLGKEGGHNTILCHAEHAILAQEGTVVGIVQAGEPHLLALAVCLHGAADLVLIAQHGAAGLLLVQQDIALCINVFLHILVVIQMVRGHVGDHSNVGACVHADQLEAGQLYHSHILRGHLAGAEIEEELDLAGDHGAGGHGIL